MHCFIARSCPQSSPAVSSLYLPVCLPVPTSSSATYRIGLSVAAYNQLQRERRQLRHLGRFAVIFPFHSNCPSTNWYRSASGRRSDLRSGEGACGESRSDEGGVEHGWVFGSALSSAIVLRAVEGGAMLQVATGRCACVLLGGLSLVVGITVVCCVNDEGWCSATKQEPASWLSGEALH